MKKLRFVIPAVLFLFAGPAQNGAVAQPRLMFSTKSPTSVGQHDLATGATDILVTTNLTEVLGVVVDTVHRKIIWINNPASGPAVIERSNLDGSNRETLNIPGLMYLTDITISGKLLWVDLGAQKIMRANFDGSNPQTLRNGTKPMGVMINCTFNKIYWSEQHTNPGGGKIFRMELDGTQQEEVLKYDGKPVKLATDCFDNKIFWTDETDKAIYVSDPGGLKVESLLAFAGNQRPYGVAADQDAGIVYWTDYLNDLVSAVYINSATVVEIFTETNPRALFWYIARSVSSGEAVKDPLGLELSPNPAANRLTVTLNIPNIPATGTISSMDGRLWKTLTLMPGRHDISIAELPPGAYLLRVQQDERSTTSRFIKQ
ncbi:MAG: T9SS type A sorting domain-containing protein [Thermoanaerobaculia bacterium]|nr:T9SS type A sorting domain-containing protein [Thermoanaerobaculia bacterium]